MTEDSTFESLRSELGPAGGKVLVSVLRDMMKGKVRQFNSCDDVGDTLIVIRSFPIRKLLRIMPLGRHS